MPDILKFHPETGEFLGARPIQMVDGVECVYPSSTFTKDPLPEGLPEGSKWQRKDDAWVAVEDHRGETAYGGDDGRQALVITDLGSLADLGLSAEPAPLSEDEQAAELEAAIASKIAAARDEQYAQQAPSFWYTSANGAVVDAHVRCGELDEQSINTFFPLTLQAEDQWDSSEVWEAAELSYDAVPLPTMAEAKAFAFAMIAHFAKYKRAFLALMKQIQLCADLDALAAIDVSDAAHWPAIGEPASDHA